MLAGLLCAVLGWREYQALLPVCIGLVLQIAGCVVYEALAAPIPAARCRFYALAVWLLAPVPCAFAVDAVFFFIGHMTSYSSLLALPAVLLLWLCTVSLVGSTSSPSMYAQF